MQPLVAHSGSAVENREGAVAAEIAHEVDVLEPRSARGNGRRGGRGRQRNHGASGDERGENQRALGLDQTLPRKWARVPDLTRAGQAGESLIDDSPGDLDHLGTASSRRLGHGVDAGAAGGVVRGVLQDQRPGSVESIRGIDAGDRRQWLRHALEDQGGLEVALLVGRANRERPHQDVGACRRAQFAAPAWPAELGQAGEVVVEAGEPDQGSVQPSGCLSHRCAQCRLREDVVVAIHQ